MALAAPDDFYAYIGAGQIADDRPVRERAAYERVLRLATAAGDQTTLADLAISGPDPFREPRDPARVAAFRRAWGRYNAALPPDQTQEVLAAPHWSLADAIAIRTGMAASEAWFGREWGEHYDFSTLGPSFRLPVSVIQGDADIDAPIELARAWLDRIEAPAKAFIAIPGAGDHMLQTHAALFRDALDKLVRPLTR
jgi:pimeloyl-ACP methyl ester carboxylesterase